MRKIIFAMALFCLSAIKVSSQVNLFWNVNGNSTTNGNWLGTINNEPLIFKTNSLEAMRIKPNGEIKIAAFENIGKGLVTFNNNGVLTSRIFPHDTNQIFCGSGNFKSIATLSGWTRTGNVLYNSPGVNVGIGTSSPQFALDVVGSAYFTGTVSAQGVILTNKLLADTMKAGSMFDLNNNLHMTAGGINQIYTSTGDLRFQSDAGNNRNTIFSAGTSGNVGIGTFNPQAKLDVNGSMRVNGTINAPQFAGQGYGFVGIDPNGNFLFFPDPSLDPGNPNFCNPSPYNWNLHGNANVDPNTDFLGTCDGNDLVIRTNSLERMRVLGDGRIGFGTSSPNFKFQVNIDPGSQTAIPAAAFVSPGAPTSNSMFIVPRLANAGYNPISQNNDFGIFWSDGLGVAAKNQDAGFVIAPWSDFSNGGIRISPNGNVGIGVFDPQYPLDVCGVIRAKEIRVEITGCDFVFDSTYQLMPIDSLKLFIASHHHLPEIAPASKMESGGVALGELNSQYLQKIEELTLYIIQLNERIAVLEEQVNGTNAQPAKNEGR